MSTKQSTSRHPAWCSRSWVWRQSVVGKGKTDTFEPDMSYYGDATFYSFFLPPCGERDLRLHLTLSQSNFPWHRTQLIKFESMEIACICMHLQTKQVQTTDGVSQRGTLIPTCHQLKFTERNSWHFETPRHRNYFYVLINSDKRPATFSITSVLASMRFFQSP